MQLYQLQQHSSGLLSPGLFDEIDANTAKETMFLQTYLQQLQQPK